MQLAVLDYETHYAKDYSLRTKGMTTQKYVLDERFKVHGCGIKLINGGKASPAKWITAKHLPTVFGHIDWANTAMVGHNLPFDGSILAWHYGIRPARYIDTLALARAQIGANSSRHGLDALGELLLGSGKPEGLTATYGHYNLTPQMEADLGRYCEDDCEKTYKLMKLLMPGMSRMELDALDWTIRTFVTPKFVLDVEALTSYLAQLDRNKAEALASVGLTSREMLNSSEQFAEALRYYGVEPPVKASKKTNADGSTKMIYAFAKTDDGLKELLDHEKPEVQALVAARLEIKSTNEETKATAYLDSTNYGSWPVDIKYAGAMNTQRFSGSSGGGGNPQNLGQKSPIRMAIQAPAGYKIVAADLSQIECRITLQLAVYHYLWNRTINDPPTCREMEALDTMRNGGDLYCWFGGMIYGREINRDDDPVERQVSKAAVLGLGFGMGWKRFLAHCREKNVPMTEEMAKRIVTLYRKTFPNVVKSWKASLQQLADLQGGMSLPAFRRILDPTKAKLTSNSVALLVPEFDPLFNEVAVRMPNGQYIKYPQLTCVTKGRQSEWSYTNRGKKTFVHPGKIFENYVQALAGLIMRGQLVEVEKELASYTELDMGVELSVHDELVALVADEPDYLAWARQLLDDVMTKPVDFMPELPIAIERKEGYCYGECH